MSDNLEWRVARPGSLLAEDPIDRKSRWIPATLSLAPFYDQLPWWKPQRSALAAEEVPGLPRATWQPAMLTIARIYDQCGWRARLQPPQLLPEDPAPPLTRWRPAMLTLPPVRDQLGWRRIPYVPDFQEIITKPVLWTPWLLPIPPHPVFRRGPVTFVAGTSVESRTFYTN